MPPAAERSRDYDRWRGSARQRGYDRSWERAAEQHRIDNPLCLGCEAAGLVVPTELVDHVEPHRGDMVKFWNRARWQSSCRWHHDVVKPRLEAMLDRGELQVDDLWLDSPAALALAASLR